MWKESQILVLVTGQQFSVHCSGCGKYQRAGDKQAVSASGRRIDPDMVYANIDDTPFEAYYCSSCAVKIQTVEDNASQTVYYTDTEGKAIAV